MCGIGQKPASWCDELSDDGVYCEEAIDLTGKRCKRARRMRRFLRKPQSECPLQKWGPEKVTDDG